MNKRLVSGIQPTGALHLGNYLGAIKQWTDLQHDYDAFYFIADYHALTGRPSAAELSRNTLELVAMLVALGVDPKKCALFLQSAVPEHTELGWILNNFATLGQLNRMTQFKEKSDQYGQYVGLFTYPVLQTADIALYGAETVPVGEDQVQHLELAREIIRNFNSHVGSTVLVEPKPLLTKAARVMALNDPTKKMSKSIPGSAVLLTDDSAALERTLKRAVTDSDPNSTSKSPAITNLFMLLENFSEPETVRHFDEQYTKGTIRYSELKEQLIEDIGEFLAPVQKTYEQLLANPDQLKTILAHGAEKARPIAIETVKRAKEALGL